MVYHVSLPALLVFNKVKLGKFNHSLQNCHYNFTRI
jgi:hypothetical protein